MKELFDEIDQEKDGEIYLKEVVCYLRAMNEDIDSLEVKQILLDSLKFLIVKRLNIFLINMMKEVWKYWTIQSLW